MRRERGRVADPPLSRTACPMAPDLEQPDLARLRRAARRVIVMARIEADAFRKVVRGPANEPLNALHAAHMNEIDAMQALLAALDLVERRASR